MSVLRQRPAFCFDSVFHRTKMVYCRFKMTFKSKVRYQKGKVVTHSSRFLFDQLTKILNPHQSDEDFTLNTFILFFLRRN